MGSCGSRCTSSWWWSHPSSTSRLFNFHFVVFVFIENLLCICSCSSKGVPWAFWFWNESIWSGRAWKVLGMHLPHSSDFSRVIAFDCWTDTCASSGPRRVALFSLFRTISDVVTAGRSRVSRALGIISVSLCLCLDTTEN